MNPSWALHTLSYRDLTKPLRAGTTFAYVHLAHSYPGLVIILSMRAVSCCLNHQGIATCLTFKQRNKKNIRRLVGVFPDFYLLSIHFKIRITGGALGSILYNPPLY